MDGLLSRAAVDAHVPSHSPRLLRELRREQCPHGDDDGEDGQVAPTAPTDLRFTFQTDPPELWLAWSPSTDDTDSQALILYETYLNGVLVPDGLVGGTNTIAYCRDIGPTSVVVRAVDTSGNRSGPSNELNINC